MNIVKFEILAKLNGLDINKNEHKYLNPKTELAWIFYDARQAEIDKLKQEVCDLSCAARMFQHVLDNPVQNKVAKFCTVQNMNFDGEVLHGTFDGTHYVLDDGDCYLPDALRQYYPQFIDIDPRGLDNLVKEARAGHSARKDVRMISTPLPYLLSGLLCVAFVAYVLYAGLA